jgi:hypothetical protein
LNGEYNSYLDRVKNRPYNYGTQMAWIERINMDLSGLRAVNEVKAVESASGDSHDQPFYHSPYQVKNNQ